MRIFAITQKVLKELFRDKRTLAMMFIAPIFIMFLMNVMFSANNNTNVTIGIINVEDSLITNIDKIKHVKVVTYDNVKAANNDVKKSKIDVYFSEDDTSYHIRYANTDSSKTVLIKQAVNTALNISKMKRLSDSLTTITSKNPASQKLVLNQNKKIKQSYNYGNEDTGFFAKMIPILMGFMVFFFFFLISGMALLKERTSGTLDRLLATPVKRSDIVFGYMLSYGIIAIIQTAVIVLSTIWLLNIQVVGNIANVILINFVLALVALSFGILMSTVAKSEFQMMQFIPLIVMPQLFFSGIIPLENMADWAQSAGKILPLYYAGDALKGIILHGSGMADIFPNILFLCVFLILLTTPNIVGLKRYRKV